jgi:hypothetical protein
MAPKLADCDFEGDAAVKTGFPDSFAVGALTNQLSHQTILNPSARDILKPFTDASLAAIIDCSPLIRDGRHAGSGTSDAFSNL